MRVFSDVFPKQPHGAGRSRRGSPWASARRRILAELTVSLIIGIAIFLTAAGSLSMEGAKASQPAATSRASKLVETAFASFNLQSAKAGAVTLQRNNACGDITFLFLHRSCSKLRKVHFGRNHRPSTPRSAVLAHNP